MTPSEGSLHDEIVERTSVRRIGMVYTIILFLAAAQMAGAVISGALQPGEAVDLGLFQLRITSNSGVAFGVGASWPAAVVIGLTGAVIFGLTALLLRRGPSLSLVARLAGSAAMAGAISNLVDRILRGAVTDYFHTGWFPTFNLADVFITVGGIVVAWSLLRAERLAVKES